MPSTSEAVERAAVANGGKNLIDRGPRCYERSPGELLPQTFPSEPSTAVEQQQANPLPDLPPRCPRHHALHVVIMAGSARLHCHRFVDWRELGTSSCSSARFGAKAVQAAKIEICWTSRTDFSGSEHLLEQENPMHDSDSAGGVIVHTSSRHLHRVAAGSLRTIYRSDL